MVKIFQKMVTHILGIKSRRIAEASRMDYEGFR